jgi:hypothetical protein
MVTRVRIIISIGALLVLFVRGIFPTFLPTDAVTIGFLVAAVLPWLGMLFDTAELPGGWKFKFQKLEAQAKQLEEKIDNSRDRIDNLFIGAMSPLALNNLRKIASGNFGPYFLGPGLQWQLLYFASLEYILFKCRGIDEIPQNGHEPKELNLSDYVEISTIGQEYLALRELIDARKQKSKI